MVRIEAGDVLLFRADESFIEKAISEITRSPYVHCAIAVGDGTLIEANGFIKTREIPLSEEPGFDVYRIPGLTVQQKEEIVNYAKAQIGTGYDYEEIVGLLIRFAIMHKFPGFHEEGHFICSGLVDDAFNAANVPRKNQDFIGNIAPGELLEYYKLDKVLA